MPDCNLCGATGLSWHENLRCLVSQVTGQKHGYNLCLIKVPRFELFAGVMCYRSSGKIAEDIVKRCMSAGINPDRVRPRVEGEYVIIKP